MADLVTLVADLGEDPPPITDLTIRPARVEESESLGALYFESYPAGVAGEDLVEATDDIRASFDGAYGDLIESATLVAVEEDQLIGAVMTVRGAPWDGVPDSPFIIELFVDPTHRRRGIARSLLSHAMSSLREIGANRVGLRVDADDEAAVALYTQMGFTEFHPPS